MKKLLSIMIFVLAVTVSLQFIDESKASAEYGLILVYEDDTSAIYVDDDTLKCNDDGTEIRISAGEKNKRSYDDTIWMNSYKFIYKNDKWTLYILNSISGRDIRNSRANSPMFTEHWSEQGPVSGVFKTILNYCLKRTEPLIRQAQERKRQEEERKRREEENKRREEQERLNKFNALIAEGDKYYTAKDYENARKAYQQARQINSSKVDEYCNNLIKNGDNLFNQKLYDSAKDYYKKAEIMGKEVEPKNPEKLQELGNNYSYAKQYERALDYYTKAISLLRDESNYEYRYDKIENKPNFINTGNPNSEKYREVWTKILGYTSYISNIAKCYYQMGLCYENLDNINKAVEMYKNVISEYDADSFKKRSKSYKQLKSDAKKKISELKKKQNKN